MNLFRAGQVGRRRRGDARRQSGRRDGSAPIGGAGCHGGEERGGGYTPFYLPEECVAESFEEGEVVWSAFYDQAAIIHKEEVVIDYEKKYGSKCYNVYVFDLIEWNPDMLVSGWIGEPLGAFYSSQIA